MANDFSGDDNIKALYNFEDGALGADSKGTNTLTNNNGVTADADAKQGSWSADFEADGAQFLNIADGNLDSGYPLKSGESNKVITVSSWVKLESETTWNSIWGKWSTVSARSLFLMMETDRKPKIFMGYNNGVSTEASSAFGTSLSLGSWYHLTYLFSDSAATILGQANKNYGIAVWDDGANDWLDSHLTGTFVESISITTAEVSIGSMNAGANVYDGRQDEMVIAGSFLTEAQILTIIAQTFGAAVGDGNPWWYYQRNKMRRAA